MFDNAGRLAGVAIAGADQRDHLISILDLDALLPSAPEADAAGAKPAITQPMDAIYEGALRTALQVLIAR